MSRRRTTARRRAAPVRPDPARTSVTRSALALAVAAALVLLGAPDALRTLVALPTLVLVAGAALTRLLLGPPTVVAAGRPADDPGATPPGAGGPTADRLLRLLLAVVLGTMALLGSVLAGQAAGFSVGGPSVLLGALALALVLVLAAQLRQRGDEPRPRAVPTLRAHWRPVLAAALAAALLSAGLGVATAAQHPAAESYALLAFGGSAPYAADPIQSAAGAEVALDLVLTSYGARSSDAAPRTTLTVAGAPAKGARTTWQAEVAPPPPVPDDTVTGATAVRTARVVFRAAREPGLYPVEVNVATAGSDPLVLTTYVEVTP